MRLDYFVELCAHLKGGLAKCMLGRARGGQKRPESCVRTLCVKCYKIALRYVPRKFNNKHFVSTWSCLVAVQNEESFVLWKILALKNYSHFPIMYTKSRLSVHVSMYDYGPILSNLSN